jgi:hypothetical protein
VYQDSSFKIPAIYLNDWPDRYIHTNFDTAANIDPTKLKRAAFIGAASGYYLAMLAGHGGVELHSVMNASRSARMTAALFRSNQLSGDEETTFMRNQTSYDGDLQRALHLFLGPPEAGFEVPSDNRVAYADEPKATGDGLLIFSRQSQPKGPLAVFGSNYFMDRAKTAGIATPKLLEYEGLWGSGEEYAYEVLNCADGKRNALEIRNVISAEYGPVPTEVVVEYLQALEKIGIVERAK